MAKCEEALVGAETRFLGETGFLGVTINSPSPRRSPMKADLVVDVGNTRIKWGRCTASGISDLASLPQDDAAAWQAQLAKWSIAPRKTWVVSGVVPKRR